MTPGERLYRMLVDRLRDTGFWGISVIAEYRSHSAPVLAAFDAVARELEIKPERGWYWVRPTNANERPRVQMAQYGAGGWWLSGVRDPRPNGDYEIVEGPLKPPAEKP